MRYTESDFNFLVKCLVIFAMLYFGYNAANAQEIKIAVIDTGFDFDSNWSDSATVTRPKLCNTGHKDFTGTSIKDTHGHGTHIAGLVGYYAGNVDYCLIILKYYDENSTGAQNLSRGIAAMRYAKALKVDFINYSGGGVLRDTEEELVIKSYLDAGGQFVAAAGNEGDNSDFFHFYPANYDSRIVVVGATKDSGEKWDKSNYGESVDFQLPGVQIFSILPDNKYGLMSGSSQSTAKVTGILAFKKGSTKMNRSISRDDRTANK